MSQRGRRRGNKSFSKRKQPGARRNDQAGKAMVRRIVGDTAQITYPDNGAAPLKMRVPRYQKCGHNGFGSHMNGKHKQG